MSEGRNGGLPTDHLSHRDFEKLATFVEEYCGIRMPQNKKTLVEGRLRRRARALGMDSISQYYHHVFDNGVLDTEITHLIDVMTTNKTEFFRENDHFTYLVDKAIPDLMTRHHRPGLERALKVWSAACSTGAEPYTLAMLLDDFGQTHLPFRFSIFATDICDEVLDAAKQGVYPAEMMDPVPRELLFRYVHRSRDPRQASVRMTPKIRQMVRFGHLNLMDDVYAIDDDMDVIFCRNILIYFNKQTQEMVLNKLCRHLRPGGYLFLGHSESTAGMKLPVQSVTTTVFMRD